MATGQRDTQDSVILGALTVGNQRATQDTVILGAITVGNQRDTQDTVILGATTSSNHRDTQDVVILWTPINYSTGITVITGGSFQDGAGNPVSNGTLIMYLSQDAKVVTSGKVVQGIRLFIPLDTNGNVKGTQNVVPNDVLVPSGTTYKVWVENSLGAQVWGPHNETVTSVNPFSLTANWVTTT